MFTKFLIDKMDRKTQQQLPHRHSQFRQQPNNQYSARMMMAQDGGSQQAIQGKAPTSIQTPSPGAESIATLGKGKKIVKSVTVKDSPCKRDDQAPAADANLGTNYRYYGKHSGMALPSAQTVNRHQALVSQSVSRVKQLTDTVMRTTRRNAIKELTTIHNRNLQTSDKNKEALRELQDGIPEINKIFDVQFRIGSGTFSTVFLGTLQRERTMSESQRRRFAIKHHNPTSHPERILRELECMFRIGGVNNVIGISCCIRYNDNVAFVMPYMTHDRFHDIYRNMGLQEIKDYIRNLLIALRHVHKFNVIHRDVKPSNILYNRRTGKFLLCDFGLAQRIANDGTVIQASDLSPAAAAALLRDMEAARHLMLQDGNSAQAEAEEYLAKASKERAMGGGGGVNYAVQQNSNIFSNQEQRKALSQSQLTKKELALQKADTLKLISRLRFISSNVDPNNYVVSTKNMRKESHASRAGTPGYRPPEVLMRYPYQTTAVDVWAVGVIMLSFLSSMHPFFKAPNDCGALSEIINLFGDVQVRKTAFMLDRLVLLTQKMAALDLRRVCMRFRYADLFLSPDTQRRYKRADGTMELCRNCEQPTFNCLCKHSSHRIEQYEGIDTFPHQAYDLLSRLLEVDPHKRITADEALKHPFFSDHHRIISGVPQQHQSQGAISSGLFHSATIPQMRLKETFPMTSARNIKPYGPPDSISSGTAKPNPKLDGATTSNAPIGAGTGHGAGAGAGAGGGTGTTGAAANRM